MLSLLTFALVPALVGAAFPPRLPGVDIQRLKDLRNQRQSQNLDLSTGILAPATAVSDGTPETQYLDIPIDHFGTSPGTFKNRYWYNDTFYASGGPVVLMDIGESNAADFAENGFLSETDLRSGVMQIARKYNGIGVIWEHRYYGGSIPFANGQTAANLTAEQYKYHTVEQALEDVVYFSAKFATNKISNDDLKPANTPWIVLGGSYPGVRAALLRVRNPETIFASWASSAPVQAQVNMSSYWGAVERALPRNCSNDFVAMTSFVDDTFRNGNQSFIAAIKRFLVQGRTSGSTVLTDAQALALPDASVAMIVMDPVSDWQRTGFNGAIDFCDDLQTFNNTQTATADGVFATYDQITAVREFVVAISNHGLRTNGFVSPSAITPAPLRSRADTPVNTSFSADYTSWTRQYCSEFGFFMGANPENKRSIETQFYTMDSVQQQCDSIWGSSIPSSPAVRNVLKFGDGWNMNPTRVMFTNGEFDPWKTLSVASTEYNSPQRSASETIPASDESTANGTYFGTIYTGQVHAIDMAAFDGDEPERIAAFDKGLDLFTRALDQWLPKFNTSQQTAAKNTSGTTSTNNKEKNSAINPRISFALVPAFTLVVSIFIAFA